MARERTRGSDIDREIDQNIEGFLDAMTPKMPLILSLVALVLAFYFFLWPSVNVWGMYAITAIAFILQLVFAMFFMIVQFGALFWFLGRGRTYWIMPGETGVTFADYKGNPEVLEAARQMVVLLRGVQEFKQMGGEYIRGLLLVGPPGTGKSYLAQAISTEAGVPFGYLSAPSLTSMFMGIGNVKVMMLYGKARKMARKHGACIVFIDEIDAIGTARSSGSQGGGMGMGMGGLLGGGGAGLLNELLLQMDPPPTDQGWQAKLLRSLGLRRKRAEMPPVLTCAATNIPDTLDQALMRPGRFDRKIRVGLPTAAGRREILLYYLNKVRHVADIDVDRMVQDTRDYTPVAIKYVLNEAIIHAHFDAREEINYDDFSAARDTHEFGIRQPVKEMSPLTKRRIAYHEAGHAVAQLEYGPMLRERFEKVTLMRYGNMGEGVGGFSLAKPTEEMTDHARSAEEFLADIRISIASRAAEEVCLGTRLNGVGGDFGTATRLASQYLYYYGMNGSILQLPSLYLTVATQVVADPSMQVQVERLLQDQFVVVKDLIVRRRADVEAIAEALIERDELNGRDVDELLAQLHGTGTDLAASTASVAEPDRGAAADD